MQVSGFGCSAAGGAGVRNSGIEELRDSGIKFEISEL
jgi:hypothetical protein